jgi:DNA-3-methyladenine glycosylase II
MQTFSAENFESICHQLASQDTDFQRIIDSHGVPPMWTREPSFATLIHIILEQQVSIMAAKSCFEKLTLKIGKIEPEYVLLLTDEELRNCGFSRQKMGYARHLAHEILRGALVLEKLQYYLMFALKRVDLFPIGDLALVNGLKTVKNLPKETSKETLLVIAEKWRPYRTIATFLLWHEYIIRRKIVY